MRRHGGSRRRRHSRGPGGPSGVRLTVRPPPVRPPGWWDRGPGVQARSRALTALWLDVPWRVAGWRIVKRHVLDDVHRTNQHPGYRRLWKFLVWSRWFYTAGPEDADAGAPQDTRWGALQLLEDYREKLIKP